MDIITSVKAAAIVIIIAFSGAFAGYYALRQTILGQDLFQWISIAIFILIISPFVGGIYIGFKRPGAPIRNVCVSIFLAWILEIILSIVFSIAFSSNFRVLGIWIPIGLLYLAVAVLGSFVGVGLHGFKTTRNSNR